MTVDEISKLTITAISEGFDKATADVNRLTSSTEGLQIMSEKSATSTGKIQSALDKQQRSLDGVYNAQQAYNRSQLVLTQALNSGVLSQTRFGELTALNEQRMKRASDAASLFQKETGKIGEVAAVVESRMAGMSASLGVVGEVLSVIGPFGLAAAVGLGAVVVAAIKFAEAANAMGDWARRLQETSDTIGINTTQLQALDSAAERVGVNAESNAAAFEHFTISLGALKLGSGALYTELGKVNPSLVNQLSLTKSNADAWNLLAKAYAQADTQQQALIGHAAFGKGGAAEGRVLAATNQAGGISGLVDENAVNAFTQDQINHWKELRSEISSAISEASRNIESIFTGPVLEAEAKFANKFLEFSQSVKGFAPSDAWHKFITDFTDLGNIELPAPLLAFFQTINRGLGVDSYLAKTPSFPKVQGGEIPPLSLASAGFPTALGQFPAAAGAGGADRSPGVLAEDWKKYVAALGPAASATEHLQAKIAALNVTSADAGLSTTDYGRALNALRLESVIQVESRRNGLLGDLASVTDVAKQKQDELNLAVAQGIKFSAAEISAMQTRNKLLAESNTLESRMVFDRQQLFKSSADQGVDATLRAAGIPPASDRAAALRDYMRMTDALKQVNDVGGTFASGFLTDLSHGTNAVDALHNALTRLSDTLIDMISRQLFNSALGGLAGSLGLTKSPVPSAMGNAFDRGNVIPFAVGGIVDRPMLFPMANGAGLIGEAGPEAIMPLKRGSDGRLGVAGGGGSQTINVNMSVDVSGATGDRAIVALVQKSAQAAVKQAVNTANAQAPARQLAYHQLGT